MKAWEEYRSLPEAEKLLKGCMKKSKYMIYVFS